MKIGIIDDKSSSGGVDPPDPPDPGGDYPSILSITVTQDNSSPHHANMPATVNAGDLLILITANTSFGSLSGSPAGWTLVEAFSSVGSDCNVYYKRAVGNEDGSSVQVHTSSGVEVLSAVIRIKDVHASQAPEAALDKESSTNAPNTPPIDPSWADDNNLIISAVLTINPSSPTSYPSGYGLYHYALSASGGSIFAAAKEVAVSSAQDPGAFGAASAVSCYLATLAVRGL